MADLSTKGDNIKMGLIQWAGLRELNTCDSGQERVAGSAAQTKELFILLEARKCAIMAQSV